jgi:branched-chain amino acid transport system permease protein
VLIEEVIVYGVVTGGMLALLALGFTLIYGVAEVVNMAHGALFMIGAYIYWFLTASDFPGLSLEPIQLNPILAIIIAAILTAIIGMIIYKLVISPVIDDLIAALVATVGVIIILQETMIIQFKANRWPVAALTEPGFVTVLGVKVLYSQLLAVGVSLCIFAVLWIFINKSKIGSSMRAVAQDREVAMLMGINTERLYMLTMAISASIAAIAGVLYTASTSGFAYPHMWDTPLYLSFAIVILGGLGSVKGTLLGAFIIAFTEKIFIVTMTGLGVSGADYLRSVVAMAVMVAVLLLRPKGLFGKRVEMEE